MKPLLTLPLLLLSLVSFPSWSETMDDLVERDGLYYKKFSDVPFSGKIDSGKIDWLRGSGWINQGRKNGKWIAYYPNGQLYKKEEYKNGERDGLYVAYWSDGQLFIRGEYRNDKKEGAWIVYGMGGNFIQKESGVYKNGKKISD